MVDDHDDAECLLGSPTPGDDRRPCWKENAPARTAPERRVRLPGRRRLLRQYV